MARNLCGHPWRTERREPEPTLEEGKGRGTEEEMKSRERGPKLEDCTADKNLLSGVKFKDDRQQ